MKHDVWTQVIQPLLSDCEGDGLDNVTRAMHVLDTVCQQSPDAIMSVEEMLRDEAGSDEADDHDRVIAAALSLLLRSMLRNVRQGLGVSPEAKDRFNGGGR